MIAPGRWITALALALLAPAALAQNQAPHIGYIFPAGGRAGTTVEITLGGQYLDNVGEVSFTGNSLKGSVTEYDKPLTQGQASKLRDQVKELQERKLAVRRFGPATKATWSADDDQLLTEIMAKLAKFVRKPSNPSLAEITRVHVAIPPNAQPCDCDLRLGTPRGLTNPMLFEVSTLPEVIEEDSLKSGLSETTVTLPVVVNGRIMPGDVDRWRFSAKRGQKLVAIVSARKLVPYIADAVPGWFQATLALYDSKGKELSFVDDYRFDPDPVMMFEVPADGEYSVEIHDSIYRGREDFVYRIAIGELPFITSIFPLGTKAGVSTPVELRGWNLPQTMMTMDCRNRFPGVYPISVGGGLRHSNTMPFAVEALSECPEREPNDTIQTAQALLPPIIVNGRIDKPGDVDVFRVEGKANQELVAEITARRLNSPLDSLLRITDASGKQIATNDDYEDKGAGLETFYADSYILTKLPADGSYYIHLGDTQHQGGSEFAYRLRVSPPRPDFALRASPSSIAVRGGTSSSITVTALRKDGFTGEIVLSLKNPAEGFTLSGAKIPAKQDQAKITLAAPPSADKEAVKIELQGKATIAGREITHAAVPADDMMQAFAYHHLVPADDMEVQVAGRSIKRTFTILTPAPLKIPSGGSARLRVQAPSDTPMGQLKMELPDAPAGLSIKDVRHTPEVTEITIQADATIKPGTKGNLILTALVAPNAPGAAKGPNSNKRSLGSLPAVPYEIVPR